MKLQLFLTVALLVGGAKAVATTLPTAGVAASTTEPTAQLQAASARAETAYVEALVRALRASASPRERAMSTLVSDWNAERPSTPAERGKVLRDAARAAPTDPLVQSLWANAAADESGCDARTPCPERRFALAGLEPDNAVAWLPGFADLDPVRDEADIQKLLKQVAASNRADLRFVDFIEAWLRIFRARPLPSSADDGEDPETYAAISHAVTAFPGFTVLAKACRRSELPSAPAPRFELCAAAGRKLRDASDTILMRAIGAVLVELSGVATAQDRGIRRELHWLQYSGGDTSSAGSEESRRYVSDLLATRSEIRAIELRMARMGIAPAPPADWQDPGE